MAESSSSEKPASAFVITAEIPGTKPEETKPEETKPRVIRIQE